MKPGVHFDMPASDYDLIPAARSTIVRECWQKTPAHAKWIMDHGKERTAALDLGNALHVATLEPDRFDSTYLIMPDLSEYGADFRSPAKRAARDAWLDSLPEGAQVIGQEDRDTILRWRDALLSHETCRALLTGQGRNEVSVVWDDPLGVRCKVRLDRLTDFEGWMTIIDLKSAMNASPRKFGMASTEFGYHIQAGFYLRGLEYAVGEADRRFIFIALEKGPPTLPAVYELADRDLDLARKETGLALSIYARCHASGVWPGYAPGVQRLALPEWKHKEAEIFSGGGF